MSQEPLQIAQELARIARENDLAEIEYRGQDFRLRLTFEYPEKTVVPAAAAAPMGESTPAGAPVPVAEPVPVPSSNPTVNSPLAGVFYRASRPGSPPYVEGGQTVQAGQTLCIVEAMKLMNEIGAEVSMRVLKILVENGSVVDSGQALFEYEPLG